MAAINCGYQTNGGNRILLDCAQDVAGLTDGVDIVSFGLHWGVYAVAAILGLWLLMSSVKVANQWERMVILRLGKFARVAGPGIFFKIPFIEKVTEDVSLQIEVTKIKAEKALTKDTVPVNVQTVMFWRVIDPRAAVIEVADYWDSLKLAAQTALREAIGAHDFTELLSQRESVDKALLASIGIKAVAWGLEVQSIEIQDVEIPEDLQDAMSREAQAEREQHARTILAESEVAIAHKLVDAAKVYDSNETALQLRAMNIIYETTKERGSTILLPTSMLDALSSAFRAKA